MRVVVLALAMLWAAGPALAQTEAASAAPAAIAQDLVAQAEATDLFEILPSDRDVVVRHTRSGLVCRMDARATNRIVVFPQAARGEDVACDSTRGGASTTLYATRFSFDTTLQEQIRGAEAAIRNRFPAARAVAGTEPEPASSRTVEFLVTHDGAPMYTRASVAILDGWTIKLRYTAAAADEAAAVRAQATAAALWRTILAEIAAGPVS